MNHESKVTLQNLTMQRVFIFYFCDLNNEGIFHDFPPIFSGTKLQFLLQIECIDFSVILHCSNDRIVNKIFLFLKRWLVDDAIWDSEMSTRTRYGISWLESDLYVSSTGS